MLVQIVQPVVPHYRVPLFDAIAAAPDVDLRLDASRQIPGSPASAAVIPTGTDLSHNCLVFANGRAFWQLGLRLRCGMSQGDVLVINGNPRYLSNYPLMLEARRRGVGVVWWGHGWSPTSTSGRARIRYQLMALADSVLVYTDEEIPVLEERGIPRERLFAANNAIDERAIVEVRKKWPADRVARFGLQHGLTDRRLLLFAGRLRARPSCGLDLAIRAMPRLLGRDPSYLLAVVGDGDAGSSLRHLAGELGVAHAIRWLGALYDENLLAPWFLSSRCFVYPGAIGLSLLHSFAYGLPVVTHDQRTLHNPEIAALTNNMNGIMFRMGDAADLADKIQIVAGDDMTFRSMSNRALDTVTSKYSLGSMVSNFLGAVRHASWRSRGRGKRGSSR